MEKTNGSTDKQDYVIYLDAEYLSGAPNEKNIEISSRFDHLGLKEEIIHGAPSCFIISGYRGVGKTSLVQNLKREIEEEYNKKDKLKDDKEILFVSCNFVNGDKKENILRKLIRQLVSSSSENLEVKLKNNTKLDDELSSLYKKTFYSVEDNQIKTTTNTFTWTSSINFVILLFIFLLVPIFYGFDFLRGMLISFLSTIRADPKNVPYATVLVSLISLFFSFLTFKIGKSFTKNTIGQTEIKTLYDEEIAEVRLNEYIEKITKMGVKIVFILDELDKFEKEDELDTFLGELKPILINGKATFLLITGQNFSNRLEKTSMVDDAILPSIVQDTYRISLPKDEELEALFLKIAQNETLDESVYKDYLNSLILKSKRIPRKFINILRKEAEWDSSLNTPKPYIKISREKIPLYKIDTKFLDCINSVIKVNVDKKNTSLLDFLMSQLCIYTEKVKLMGAASFQLEDIQIDEDLKTKFPKYYIDKLGECIQLLAEKMKKSRILTYDVTSTSYAFSEIYREDDTFDLTKKQFLKDVTKFEKLIRGIHKEIYYYEESAFFNIVKDLQVLKIIYPSTMFTIEHIMELRTEFSSFKNKKNYRIEEISDLTHQLNYQRVYIMELYTCYVVKEYFDPERFTIELGREYKSKKGESRFLTDILVGDNDSKSMYKEVFIEIKVGEFPIHFIVALERLLKSISHIKTNIKIVFIIFTSSPNSRIKTMVEDKVFNLGIKPNISLHIVAANMYRDLDDKSLKEHLRRALK
ncbi:ATP-binding protein [Peribacillus simplex]|uniref:KAP NTPase domain-containing protein n=1 Tax=Peribacillus simplex NBRC 15720 = DSM 1321 TaxID=1349754 RepID=A0A223EN54_9BACI|nr:ATP-binding protein [Peribacillus simplex]ASS96636.1 hypothetical protein BS1321_23655 [Peribacillus simplex NBRC 15720 = DSM 1321]MEC1395964.1 ATP-binding protein [Peribacillus simplex]